VKIYLTFIITCCCIGSLVAQSVEVNGTVRDDTGELLAGASVVRVGTSIGTVTDGDGKFSISVPVGSTLRVSFIGYKPSDVTISSGDPLNITLAMDAGMLDDVVVIGYGTAKKSDLTGSVASVKSEDFINTAISSIDQGLQGKVSGLVVSMSSGQPGAPSSIRIRGTNSINGNNEPLYVIDGVFIVPEINVGAVTGPSLNPLASINPNDIESIQVLKDASATAIYGTRGANGVILVTTKRGKKGAPSISINYTKSYQELRHKIPMLNAAELAVLGNEATDNAGAPRRLIYASPTNLGVGTDWQDQIFRVAPMDNLQVSARGGSESTSYSISANYFKQDGIILNSDFTKGNLRINLDQRLSDKVSIGTSLNLTRSTLWGVVTDSEGAIPSSVTSWALAFNPGLGVYDDEGEYTFENNTAQPGAGNPVADIHKTKQVSNSTRLFGNVFATWDMMKDLQFKTSIGTDAVFANEKSFVPNDIRRGEASNGQAALAEQRGYSWLLENTLNYKKTFGNHRVDAVVGHTLQKYVNEYLFVATSDFDDNRLGFNAIQVGADKTLIFNGKSGWALQSFLGRINYNLKEKYLFTASARIDGSTKFGVGNKYGTFPSLAFAWQINEEPFMNNVSFLNELKWRVGYGVVGNEGIPPYSSLGLLETTEAYFGENDIAKGSGPASRQNDQLKWETTSQFDTGFDVGLFSDRVTLVVDFYYKKTTDLLLNAPVPYTSGYASSYFNVGSLENKGFEIALNTVNTTGEIKWNTAINFALNRNKVLDLNSDEGVIPDPMLGITGWTAVQEGTPVGTFYGYKTNGIIQLSEDPESIPYFVDYEPSHGDRKYIDKDKSGVLDENDKFILGNATPDFSFGFTNNVTYKDFSLSVFIQGVSGNEIVNFNKFGLESFDGNQNNSTAALDRWTPTNPSNTYPRANVSPRVNTLSDHQVEDGSYLRVKDITLSYNFARLLANEKFRFTQFQFFVSAKNLLTITSYSGYDPEVNRFINNPLRFGADFGSYPTTKIYSTGLNIVF
jgi:TonB-linked SusC/RagA family outer membrane protein